MKSLGCFILSFALVFGLLAWPWPGLRQAVRVCFRAQARVLTGWVLPAQTFRVEAFSSDRFPTLDTCVIVADPENVGPDGRSRALGIPFDSGSQGWIPLAMLIALVVATPLPLARRWRALLAGTLAIQLLVAATILASVGVSVAGKASPMLERLPLALANHLLGENIWSSFVPPFLLWAGWIAWCGHWEQFRQSNRPRDAQAGLSAVIRADQNCP